MKREQVVALVAKWRGDAEEAKSKGWNEYAQANQECASELEALLEPAPVGGDRTGLERVDVQQRFADVRVAINQLERAVATTQPLAPTPTPTRAEVPSAEGLTFSAFRRANAARCVKWHPEGIASWSPSDWLVAVTGELGELASLLKMRNRERDGLPGNKFSPTDKMIADELADVLTYLDLLAEVLGVDLGAAAVSKFNEVSGRVGFPDRIDLAAPQAEPGEGREDGR